MFEISADKLGNNGNSGKSVHVRRFSHRADALNTSMNRKNVGGYARLAAGGVCLGDL
jgi:hypothetical protein